MGFGRELPASDASSDLHRRSNFSFGLFKMFRTVLFRRGFCNFSMLGAAILGCALLVGNAAAESAPPGWKLVWSDEFEGTSLDTSKWDAVEWKTPHNNELQAYRPSRVTVQDGKLVLTADDADFGGKAYTSGKVESKWTKQYGRFEIRAKLPGTRGTWPAIWLLPDTEKYPWPTQGEIDILENRGNQPNLTSSAYHYGPSPRERQFSFAEQRTSTLGELQNYHDEFHTYVVEWDKSMLKFFVDDVHYFTLHDADLGGFLGKQTAPAEIVLNVAVGGDFVEDAPPDDSSIWPQAMMVDYVRVYERTDAPPPKVLVNDSFEANDGSLAGWSTFGNRPEDRPNVQVHNEAASSGKVALKLFGQFSGKENYSGVQQAITVSPGDSITASIKSFIHSADSIAGTDNRVDMKFDYYRKAGGQYGSGDYINSKTLTIADGNADEDKWLSHELNDTVPNGAVEARLVLVFAQKSDKGGAVHLDDVVFKNLSLNVKASAAQGVGSKRLKSHRLELPKEEDGFSSMQHENDSAGAVIEPSTLAALISDVYSLVTLCDLNSILACDLCLKGWQR